MREVKTKIYQFSELSESAKKTALNNWIELERDNYDLSDNIHYEFKEFYLNDYGLKYFELRYSLGYSQGDGVAFYGKTYELTEMIKKLDIDTTLDVPALELEIEHVSGLYNYDHYNTMEFTLSSDQDLNDTQIKELQRVENKICAGLKELSRKLEKVGYSIIEYNLSEENAQASIEANEYEYLENGEMY